MDELYSLYEKILKVSKKNRHFEGDYAAVHIVCGESPTGSLKVGIGRENKEIGFPDFFAVGYIWELIRM